jgi:hypothetical protein
LAGITRAGAPSIQIAPGGVVKSTGIGKATTSSMLPLHSTVTPKSRMSVEIERIEPVAAASSGAGGAP